MHPRRGLGMDRLLRGSPSSCRYLNFYKQTMDLLTGNGIVSSQEVTLPIVSAAISHLWQTLSEERKAILLQTWAQKHGGLPGLAVACQEPAGAEGSVKDSGVDSQGASCSLLSTPEEVSSLGVAEGAEEPLSPSTLGVQALLGHFASLRCPFYYGWHHRRRFSQHILHDHQTVFLVSLPALPWDCRGEG